MDICTKLKFVIYVKLTPVTSNYNIFIYSISFVIYFEKILFPTLTSTTQPHMMQQSVTGLKPRLGTLELT